MQFFPSIILILSMDQIAAINSLPSTAQRSIDSFPSISFSLSYLFAGRHPHERVLSSRTTIEIYFQAYFPTETHLYNHKRVSKFSWIWLLMEAKFFYLSRCIYSMIKSDPFRSLNSFCKVQNSSLDIVDLQDADNS